MSISNPRKTVERPTKKYIKFSNKGFSYWDKEKEENVLIPLPIHFVIIDELSTITGWHDATDKGIYSNEVHFLPEDELNVRTFGGVDIAKGVYSEIKDTVKAQGGKYTKSIYALLNGELVNFAFSGAAFSSMMETTDEMKKHKQKKTNTVEVKELREEKKGANKYNVPIFVFVADDEEEIEQAKYLDSTVLQPYLNSYKEREHEATEKKLKEDDEVNNYIYGAQEEAPWQGDLPY